MIVSLIMSCRRAAAKDDDDRCGHRGNSLRPQCRYDTIRLLFTYCLPKTEIEMEAGLVDIQKSELSKYKLERVYFCIIVF